MITLVLLPGMDGTGLLFSDFISALGPEFTTHVVSYPNDPSLGYDELERIARSSLPNDRPFAILAESFSGPIAISIAASQPPGLMGLILCCSFADNPRPLFGQAQVLLKLFSPKLVSMAILDKFLLGRWSTDQLRAALRETLDSVSSNTLRARAKEVRAIDVSAKLDRIRIPIIYLQGSDDLVVPTSALDYILKTAPRVQVARLPGPHLLLQTAPSAAAQIVSNFLQSTIQTPKPS